MKIDIVPMRLKNQWISARMGLGILKAFHFGKEFIWAKRKEEIQHRMNKILGDYNVPE